MPTTPTDTRSAALTSVHTAPHADAATVAGVTVKGRDHASRDGRLPTPRLDGLAAAVREAGHYLDRVHRHREDAFLNEEGGDVGSWPSLTSLVRHVANYLAAASVAQQIGVTGGGVTDVGCGTAALGAWMADRLDSHLQVCDVHVDAITVATRAFGPEAAGHVPADMPHAAVVTGMEVIEHVAHDEQVTFVAELFDRVEPGGLLVLSTPDESGYPGASSLYPPHVGCLTASELEAVVAEATSRRPTVWRLDGDVFRLSRLRQHAERITNRTSSWLSSRVPTLVDRLAQAAASRRHTTEHLEDVTVPPVTVKPAGRPGGNGLLVAVRRG